MTVYKSTDGSAPTISNTAGGLISLLNAILVDGYGSKAAAGWTKPYTGTNAAVYKTGGNRPLYIQVNNNYSGYAEMRGYASMTSQTSGSNPFPTTAQASAGVYMPTSSAASNRAWVCLADIDYVMLWIDYAGDSGSSSHAFAFGFTDDTKKPFIVAENGSLGTTFFALRTALGSTAAHYALYDYRGVPTSIDIGKYAAPPFTGTVMGSAGVTYGSQYFIVKPAMTYYNSLAGTNFYIGSIPKLWCPVHNRAVNHLDTFSGATGTALEGETFLVLNTSSSGQMVFQTS